MAKKSSKSKRPVGVRSFKPQATRPPMPANTPAMIRNLAGQLPAGVKIKHPSPPFPPELTKRLEEARKSERYMVAVWQGDAEGNLKVYQWRSNFRDDWLMRSVKDLCRAIFDFAAMFLPAIDRIPAGGGSAGHSATPAGPRSGEEGGNLA